MKFTDYNASVTPSVAQQHDALRKGLGRTARWAMTGKLDETCLLEGCLHDLRFDRQIEFPRGEWLWSMIQATNAVDKFREPLREAFEQLSDENDAVQLCDLAVYFSKQGDEWFRRRLYEIVKQRTFKDCPWLGEEQIIALDGESGLVFAAEIRGEQLASRDWDWDDRSLVGEAMERLGENHATQALESSSNIHVQRFWKEWQRSSAALTDSVKGSHEMRMRAITVQEIINAAEDETIRYGMYRGWGMYASEQDLDIVACRLVEAVNPKTMASYLTVFSNRAVTRLAAQFIGFCDHPDETVRARAYRALSVNRHPLIRQLALAKIREGLCDGSVASLFIKNYEPGDEHDILERLDVPEDECERHWLLMDVIKILENNPEADCMPLAVTAYALTPCGGCRYNAAKHLLGRSVAPTWLAQECRYDSEKDCRSLFETVTHS